MLEWIVRSQQLQQAIERQRGQPSSLGLLPHLFRVQTLQLFNQFHERSGLLLLRREFPVVVHANKVPIIGAPARKVEPFGVGLDARRPSVATPNLLSRSGRIDLAGAKFFQYHWNGLEKGSTVIVTLSTAANVRLMDRGNFNAYKSRRNITKGAGWSRSLRSDSRAECRQLVPHHRPRWAPGHQRPTLGNGRTSTAADSEVCVAAVAKRHPT